MNERRAVQPTPRYERIIAAANRIAGEFGHSFVGAEHLFLALAEDADAIPTQVLGRFTNPHQVADSVREVMSTYASTVDTGRPTSEEQARALAERVREADARPGLSTQEIVDGVVSHMERAWEGCRALVGDDEAKARTALLLLHAQTREVRAALERPARHPEMTQRHAAFSMLVGIHGALRRDAGE